MTKTKKIAYIFLPFFLFGPLFSGPSDSTTRFSDWSDRREESQSTDVSEEDTFLETEKSDTSSNSKGNPKNVTSAGSANTMSSDGNMSGSRETPSSPDVPNTGNVIAPNDSPEEAVSATPGEDGPTIPAPPDDSSRVFPTNDANTTAATRSSAETQGTVFKTGAVTFRFDDGWNSQFEIAAPALESAGLRGTFFVSTQQTSESGFTGFMSIAEIQSLHASGHEIGAHTRTHPRLVNLSTSQQRAEIFGSRQDLSSWGINAGTFSYPFGEYDADVVDIVRDAGYSAAMTTQVSYATEGSDPYLLPSPSIRISDSVEEIVEMIDDSLANKGWLTLNFHRIDDSGDEYSITPEDFSAIVNYVKNSGIRVVTVSEGAASL